METLIDNDFHKFLKPEDFSKLIEESKEKHAGKYACYRFVSPEDMEKHDGWDVLGIYYRDFNNFNSIRTGNKDQYGSDTYADIYAPSRTPLAFMAKPKEMDLNQLGQDYQKVYLDRASLEEKHRKAVSDLTGVEATLNLKQRCYSDLELRINQKEEERRKAIELSKKYEQDIQKLRTALGELKFKEILG